MQKGVYLVNTSTTIDLMLIPVTLDSLSNADCHNSTMGILPQVMSSCE